MVFLFCRAHSQGKKMDSTVVAVAVLVTPILASILGASAPYTRLQPQLAARIASSIVGVGFGASIWLAIVIALSGPVPVSIGAAKFVVDAFAVTMLLLVLGLSAVIQSFAVRYLRGDVRQGWFVATANLVTALTALMVSSETLFTFAASWVSAGIALVLLLATYPKIAQARDGIRRTALNFAIGDLAFLLAVATVAARAGGDVPLAQLGVQLAAMPSWMSIAVSLLLVLPALARSSQVPFHWWLPSTLAAPTPVSALMHAGVVNAGAILVIRFAPALGESAIAMNLIFVAGATTLVYASIVRLAKPDVKGKLVFSTMGQMGFMMMACGLGAFAAAVFHLIAHGLFKSALFLGAGMAVREHRVRREWPIQSRPRVAVVVAATAIAIVIPVGALAIARALLAPEVSSVSLALLAFVAFSGAVALRAALLVRFSLATLAIGLGSMVGLALAYTAFLSIFDGILAADVALQPASPWLLLPVAAALIITEVIARNTGAPRTIHRILYARSLSAATPRTSNSRRFGPTVKGAMS